MSLSAQDLRIGNLHLYTVEDKHDERGVWDELAVIDAEDLVYLSNYPDDNNYKPVPLTEDWLLRAGFYSEEFFEDSRPIYVLDIDGEESFYVDWDTLQPVETGYNIAKVKIEHVHQLQNLFFAIRGKELEFKDLKI